MEAVRKWFLGAAGLVILGVTSPAYAAPAPAPSVSRPWATCVPRKIDYVTRDGIGYRLGDDLFAGKKGRLCIASRAVRRGESLTITANVRAQGGAVAAAPYIRVGPWYRAGDTRSPFPMPARAMLAVTLHVSVTGHARGEWIADADAYGYRSGRAVKGNPSIEMIIATRWHDYPRKSYGHYRISGQWWSVNKWVTGKGSPMGAHLIISFWAAHQSDTATERLPAFVGWARRHHWWEARTVGNACLQAELWSGGKGLTLGLQVTDPIPVIHALDLFTTALMR
jgi:hypothetical protein